MHKACSVVHKYQYSSNNNNEMDVSTPSSVEDEEIIDIEGTADSTPSQFDFVKANTLMTECERHMKIVRPHPTRHTDEPIDR